MTTVQEVHELIEELTSADLPADTAFLVLNIHSERPCPVDRGALIAAVQQALEHFGFMVGGISIDVVRGDPPTISTFDRYAYEEEKRKRESP